MDDNTSDALTVARHAHSRIDGITPRLDAMTRRLDGMRADIRAAIADAKSFDELLATMRRIQQEFYGTD